MDERIRGYEASLKATEKEVLAVQHAVQERQELIGTQRELGGREGFGLVWFGLDFFFFFFLEFGLYFSFLLGWACQFVRLC
jgi:hypothetical protein